MAGLLGLQDRQRRAEEAERIGGYARYLRAYQGYSIRGTLGTNVVSDWKRLKFNYNEPVVNLSAGFFASKPLSWDVKGDPEATCAAHDIWDRSGSESALLHAASAACIYGDMVGFAAESADGPVIEFVDPSIVYPTFDPGNWRNLTGAEVAYQRVSPDGSMVLYREEWGPTGMVAFEGDQQVAQSTYRQLPAVWIRNASVMGLTFGISDLHGVWDLVEEYDHIASKQTRIIDYYAAPTLAFKGLTASEFKKQTNTVVFLPSDGDAKFVEWQGSAPDVESHLNRIRNAIAEKAQVPAVAFGQADSGLSSVSGVALQILYGPLLSKTLRKRSEWGPALERLMSICLQRAGYKVTQAQVNVVWPDPLPVDGDAKVNGLVSLVGAQIRSRRGAMAELNIDDPTAELKRIAVEKKLLGLTASEAAAPETAAQDVPEPADAPETVDTEDDSEDSIDGMLSEFDEIIAAEDANLQAAQDARPDTGHRRQSDDTADSE